MNLKMLTSLLVWVAVISCASGATDLSDLEKLELTVKLNMLLRYQGWRIMENVMIMESYTIKYKKFSRLGNPMAEIFAAISSNTEPVNEFNALQRYEQIWTVFKCKYAEVFDKYRVLVQHLIRVCRNARKEDKRTEDPSHEKYFKCFHSLLTKLYISSPRFKCMRDALEFLSSIGPQLKSGQNIMVAAQRLTEFTLTSKPRTLAKLSEHGIDEDVVDCEIKTISDYFQDVFHRNISWFVTRYCDLPSQREWNTRLNQDFNVKKFNKLIPQDTTVLQYVEDVFDCFINEIFDTYFYNLGFVYDVGDIVKIGIK